MEGQSLNRIAAFGLVAVLGLGACGTSTAATQTTPSSAPQPAAASPTPSASSPPSGTAVLKTATATVSGSSTTVLVDTAGMTLYYRTSDTPISVCSGGCASAWPPLLLPSGTPSGAGTLPGTLAVLADANGNQVTYSGHPLYTFASDSAVGDTKGEGVGGVWHVATPSLT